MRGLTSTEFEVLTLVVKSTGPRQHIEGDGPDCQKHTARGLLGRAYCPHCGSQRILRVTHLGKLAMRCHELAARGFDLGAA